MEDDLTPEWTFYPKEDFSLRVNWRVVGEHTYSEPCMFQWEALNKLSERSVRPADGGYYLRSPWTLAKEPSDYA